VCFLRFESWWAIVAHLSLAAVAITQPVRQVVPEGGSEKGEEKCVSGLCAVYACACACARACVYVCLSASRLNHISFSYLLRVTGDVLSAGRDRLEGQAAEGLLGHIHTGRDGGREEGREGGREKKRARALLTCSA